MFRLRTLKSKLNKGLMSTQVSKEKKRCVHTRNVLVLLFLWTEKILRAHNLELMLGFVLYWNSSRLAFPEYYNFN